MSQSEFIDYYEMLEVSPNANTETIEKIFRYLAARFHPDVCGPSGRKRFNQLVEAYQTLRDSTSRAAYDVQFAQQQNTKVELVSGAEASGDDCADRFRMLTLFYSQRRRDMKNPGVGIMKLSQILGCPMEVLDFHVWYFRKKGWVEREEDGLLSITAEGVDEIESRNREWGKDRLITDESARSGNSPFPATGAVVPSPSSAHA